MSAKAARYSSGKPQNDIRGRPPEPDQVLVDIADYVCKTEIRVRARVRNGALLPHGYPGLRFPGAGLPGLHQTARAGCAGCHAGRVVRAYPGTSYELDPVTRAFNIGAMIRWLDFNDTWLAAEWGHPSDNLGGILATADYLSRLARAEGKDPLTMQMCSGAMIKAHEIQGVLRAGEQLQPRRPRSRHAGTGAHRRRSLPRMLGGDRPIR